MKRLLVILTLSTLFLAACGGNLPQEIEPIATTPISQPTESNTPAPQPSNTPLPTQTPLPPTPTETLSPYLFRDDFEGALSDGWRWIGEVPTNWNLTEAPGSVRIILLPSNFGDGEPKNFLVREAPNGNFEIATRVLFTPTSNFQFAGLLIYQGQGNALQFGRAFANCGVANVCIGNAIYFDLIEAGAGGKPNFATAVINQSQAYLRLRQEGTFYTGYYSEDGTDWIVIGKHESNITPLYIGLIASQAYKAETTADFDYFTIEALP